MSKNHQIEKLHENVWLFKNSLSNHQAILEDFKNNATWSRWNFGTHAMYDTPWGSYDTFPEKEVFFKDVLDPKKEEGYKTYESLKEIVDNFYDVTKYYVDVTGYEIPNWCFLSNDLAKYEPKFTPDEYIQRYHIDYQIERKDQPRHNFGLTTVTYLNDDYEGGEIVFKIFHDETEETFDLITYKPTAGDTLVFSSKWPNFHAVKQVTKGEKYFTQIVWRFWFPGSDEWFKNIEKYGEKEWEKMYEQEMEKLSKMPTYSIREF